MREIDLKPEELVDLSNDMFAMNSHIKFKAHGRSMYPSIQDGDVLDIEAAGASDLRIGEIVFFRSAGDRPTVHRLIDRRMFDGCIKLIMRGDASPWSDAPVPPERVLGRVTKIQRGAKTIVLNHDHPGMADLRIKLLFINRTTLLLARFWKRIAVSLLMRAQRTEPYCLTVGRLIAKKVRYRIAGTDDAAGLSRFYGYRRFNEPGDPVKVPAGQIDSLDGRGFILIAEIMGKIAGAVVVTECPWDQTLDRDWWLFSMLVRTRYRGAGIGEGLILKALEKSSEAGRKGISLLVSERNKAAIKLYLKMGFKPSPVPYADIESKTGYQNQDFVWLSRTVETLKGLSLEKEMDHPREKC